MMKNAKKLMFTKLLHPQECLLGEPAQEEKGRTGNWKPVRILQIRREMTTQVLQEK